MSTYGELKAEVPAMTDEALDDLRRSCMEQICAGFKVPAERDLLARVRAERVGRGE